MCLCGWCGIGEARRGGRNDWEGCPVPHRRGRYGGVLPGSTMIAFSNSRLMRAGIFRGRGVGSSLRPCRAANRTELRSSLSFFLLSCRVFWNRLYAQSIHFLTALRRDRWTEWRGQQSFSRSFVLLLQLCFFFSCKQNLIAGLLVICLFSKIGTLYCHWLRLLFGYTWIYSGPWKIWIIKKTHNNRYNKR